VHTSYIDYLRGGSGKPSIRLNNQVGSGVRKIGKVSADRVSECVAMFEVAFQISVSLSSCETLLSQETEPCLLDW